MVEEKLARVRLWCSDVAMLCGGPVTDVAMATAFQGIRLQQQDAAGLHLPGGK